MVNRFAPVLLLAAAFAGANESRPADAILAQARNDAAASQRAVWVIFHASW